jgi:hypothetical protein
MDRRRQTGEDAMFHISNLGHNARAAQFADINGYVPEAGDNWRDMNYDFGSDCPKIWKSKVEDAQCDLNEIIDELQRTEDDDINDEIMDLEQKYEEIEFKLHDLKGELANILCCLDTEWWPYLVRDAVAATAEDNAELAAN